MEREEAIGELRALVRAARGPTRKPPERSRAQLGGAGLRRKQRRATKAARRRNRRG